MRTPSGGGGLGRQTIIARTGERMHEACTKLHGALPHSMDSSGILEVPDCSWTGTPSINCSGDPCPDVFERLRLCVPLRDHVPCQQAPEVPLPCKHRLRLGLACGTALPFSCNAGGQGRSARLDGVPAGHHQGHPGRAKA